MDGVTILIMAISKAAACEEEEQTRLGEQNPRAERVEEQSVSREGQKQGLRREAKVPLHRKFREVAPASCRACAQPLGARQVQ